MRSPQNFLFWKLNSSNSAAFPTLPCSHFPLADASMWRYHSRVSLSQSPFRRQMPHESRSHLLWGSCKLSSPLRAADLLRWKGSAKALWRVADGARDWHCWLECHAQSSVEHFMPVSVSMGAKYNPSRMVAGCTLLLLTLYQSQSQDNEIQVLYFSRSSVWNCTPYVCFAFSKYLVLTLVIRGKCIQLNFPSAPVLGELVLLLGWPWWQKHFVLLHPNRPLFLMSFYSLLYPTSCVSCSLSWVSDRRCMCTLSLKSLYIGQNSF